MPPQALLPVVAVTSEPPDVPELQSAARGLQLWAVAGAVLAAGVGLATGHGDWVALAAAYLAGAGLLRRLTAEVTEGRSEGSLHGLRIVAVVGACASGLQLIQTVAALLVGLGSGAGAVLVAGLVPLAASIVTTYLLTRMAILTCATPLQDWCRGYRVASRPPSVL